MGGIRLIRPSLTNLDFLGVNSFVKLLHHPSFKTSDHNTGGGKIWFFTAAQRNLSERRLETFLLSNGTKTEKNSLHNGIFFHALSKRKVGNAEIFSVDDPRQDFFVESGQRPGGYFMEVDTLIQWNIVARLCKNFLKENEG